MAKDRDWIDYVNLGSNLLQNVQLSGVQDKLGAMAAAAASEQAKTEQEDRLREAVFQADTHVRDLRGWLDTERQGVLALATFSLANMEQNDVTSACFRKFEDKERLRSVLEGYRAVIKESETGLSAEETAEAKLCARYMANPRVEPGAPPELAGQLEKAQRELLDLTEAAKRPPTPNFGRFLEFPLVASFFASLVGAAMNVGGDSQVDVEHGAVICRISGVVFAVSLLVWLLLLLWAIPDKTTRKKREEAERLRSAKAKEAERLREQVDTALARDRSRLECERDAVMAKVLGSKTAERWRARCQGADEKTPQPFVEPSL